MASGGVEASGFPFIYRSYDDDGDGDKENVDHNQSNNNNNNFNNGTGRGGGDGDGDGNAAYNARSTKADAYSLPSKRRNSKTMKWSLSSSTAASAAGARAFMSSSSTTHHVTVPQMKAANMDSMPTIKGKNFNGPAARTTTKVVAAAAEEENEGSSESVAAPTRPLSPASLRRMRELLERGVHVGQVVYKEMQRVRGLHQLKRSKPASQQQHDVDDDRGHSPAEPHLNFPQWSTLTIPEKDVRSAFPVFEREDAREYYELIRRRELSRQLASNGNKTTTDMPDSEAVSFSDSPMDLTKAKQVQRSASTLIAAIRQREEMGREKRKNIEQVTLEKMFLVLGRQYNLAQDISFVRDDEKDVEEILDDEQELEKRERIRRSLEGLNRSGTSIIAADDLTHGNSTRNSNTPAAAVLYPTLDLSLRGIRKVVDRLEKIRKRDEDDQKAQPLSKHSSIAAAEPQPRGGRMTLSTSANFVTSMSAHSNASRSANVLSSTMKVEETQHERYARLLLERQSGRGYVSQYDALSLVLQEAQDHARMAHHTYDASDRNQHAALRAGTAGNAPNGTRRDHTARLAGEGGGSAFERLRAVSTVLREKQESEWGADALNGVAWNDYSGKQNERDRNHSIYEPLVVPFVYQDANERAQQIEQKKRLQLQRSRSTSRSISVSGMLAAQNNGIDDNGDADENSVEYLKLLQFMWDAVTETNSELEAKLRANQNDSGTRASTFLGGTTSSLSATLAGQASYDLDAATKSSSYHAFDDYDEDAEFEEGEEQEDASADSQADSSLYGAYAADDIDEKTALRTSFPRFDRTFNSGISRVHTRTNDSTASADDRDLDALLNALAYIDRADEYLGGLRELYARHSYGALLHRTRRSTGVGKTDDDYAEELRHKMESITHKWKSQSLSSSSVGLRLPNEAPDELTRSKLGGRSSLEDVVSEEDLNDIANFPNMPSSDLLARTGWTKWRKSGTAKHALSSSDQSGPAGRAAGEQTATETPPADLTNTETPKPDGEEDSVVPTKTSKNTEKNTKNVTARSESTNVSHGKSHVERRGGKSRMKKPGGDRVAPLPPSGVELCRYPVGGGGGAGGIECTLNGVFTAERNKKLSKASQYDFIAVYLHDTRSSVATDEIPATDETVGGVEVWVRICASGTRNVIVTPTPAATAHSGGGSNSESNNDTGSETRYPEQYRVAVPYHSHVQVLIIKTIVKKSDIEFQCELSIASSGSESAATTVLTFPVPAGNVESDPPPEPELTSSISSISKSPTPRKSVKFADDPLSVAHNSSVLPSVSTNDASTASSTRPAPRVSFAMDPLVNARSSLSAIANASSQGQDTDPDAACEEQSPSSRRNSAQEPDADDDSSFGASAMRTSLMGHTHTEQPFGEGETSATCDSQHVILSALRLGTGEDRRRTTLTMSQVSSLSMPANISVANTVTTPAMAEGEEALLGASTMASVQPVLDNFVVQLLAGTSDNADKERDSLAQSAMNHLGDPSFMSMSASHNKPRPSGSLGSSAMAPVRANSAVFSSSSSGQPSVWNWSTAKELVISTLRRVAEEEYLAASVAFQSASASADPANQSHSSADMAERIRRNSERPITAYLHEVADEAERARHSRKQSSTTNTTGSSKSSKPSSVMAPSRPLTARTDRSGRRSTVTPVQSIRGDDLHLSGIPCDTGSSVDDVQVHSMNEATLDGNVGDSYESYASEPGINATDTPAASANVKKPPLPHVANPADAKRPGSSSSVFFRPSSIRSMSMSEKNDEFNAYASSTPARRSSNNHMAGNLTRAESGDDDVDDEWTGWPAPSDPFSSSSSPPEERDGESLASAPLPRREMGLIHGRPPTAGRRDTKPSDAPLTIVPLEPSGRRSLPASLFPIQSRRNSMTLQARAQSVAPLPAVLNQSETSHPMESTVNSNSTSGSNSMRLSTSRVSLPLPSVTVGTNFPGNTAEANAVAESETVRQLSKIVHAVSEICHPSTRTHSNVRGSVSFTPAVDGAAAAAGNIAFSLEKLEQEARQLFRRNPTQYDHVIDKLVHRLSIAYSEADAENSSTDAASSVARSHADTVQGKSGMDIPPFYPQQQNGAESTDATTPQSDANEEAAEVQRLFRQQQRAKEMVHAVMDEVKIAFQQKQQQDEGETADNALTSRQLRNLYHARYEQLKSLHVVALELSWAFERRRVLDVNKLVALLDRKLNRFPPHTSPVSRMAARWEYTGRVWQPLADGDVFADGAEFLPCNTALLNDLLSTRSSAPDIAAAGTPNGGTRHILYLYRLMEMKTRQERDNEKFGKDVETAGNKSTLVETLRSENGTSVSASVSAPSADAFRRQSLPEQIRSHTGYQRPHTGPPPSRRAPRRSLISPYAKTGEEAVKITSFSFSSLSSQSAAAPTAPLTRTTNERRIQSAPPKQHVLATPRAPNNLRTPLRSPPLSNTQPSPASLPTKRPMSTTQHLERLPLPPASSEHRRQHPFLSPPSSADSTTSRRTASSTARRLQKHRWERQLNATTNH